MKVGITLPPAFRFLPVFPGCCAGRPESSPSQCSADPVVPGYVRSRSCDAPGVACCVEGALQFLVDALELSAEGTADVCVLGVKGLLERFLRLPQRLGLSLVGLDVCSQVV